jgi:Uma2 family endonuclease
MPATAAVTAPGVEEVVVLRDISWDTYCRLNDENFSPAIRMTFFGGALEITALSSRHENWARKIEVLVQVLSGAMGLDCETFGSATIRRKELSAGLEPDACFYFGPMAAAMREKGELNFQTDPAPELAVEVDISRRSFSKFPLYAALGIGEIWRFHEREMALYELVDGEYRPIQTSKLLPGIGGALITRLLGESQTLPSPEWQERVRAAALEAKS